MSDPLKHECGIAMVRLLKPLEYYKDKYGTSFYGMQKMYLMMEKQHNRGQDGAGITSVKLDVPFGKEYIHRERSNQNQPIKGIFSQINKSIDELISLYPSKKDDFDWMQQNAPFMSEVFLGHVRYGTFGKNTIETVHPFLRESNWKHRSLLLAGNFNLTNSKEIIEYLIELGQHPKENADTVIILEKIGHFIDNAVADIYQSVKDNIGGKKNASEIIEQQLDIADILRQATKNFDGGYALAGILGHGDSFVVRDPSGIRPVFYYQDEEVIAVASERPALQTVFNAALEDVKELERGSAIITKKDGTISIVSILPKKENKACSFERIYFSRGNDASIYKERKKLGELVLPLVLDKINNDIENTVFSFIPNTAEISFYGITEAADEVFNLQKIEEIIKGGDINADSLKKILSKRLRVEKIAIKDAKLRTFITDDANRDDLVAHVYDITYGVVKPTDNLMVIDDSIVRGTTLKKSIIKILDRLKPKRIVVVSSAPQIRYPDCYGIDMARITDFIAFKAAIELLKEQGKQSVIEGVYTKAIAQKGLPDVDIINHVKDIYNPFTDEQISDKIAQMLKTKGINAEIDVVYQTVENLHIACPDNPGDWYFTGNYPTPGGNRVVNDAFINYYEGNSGRAY